MLLGTACAVYLTANDATGWNIGLLTLNSFSLGLRFCEWVDQ